MAFTPFLQGTQAQSIINDYLGSGGFNQPFPSPSVNPYIVESTPFIPPAAQPTPDTPDTNIPNCDELYPGEGRVYDPVLQACVLPEMETQGDGDNNTPETVFQGVGSVFSPEQNAFMNLGLGGSTADDVKSYFGSGEIDPYGSGVSGFFRRFTPFGQFSTFRDVNTLVDSGILDRASDGTLTFAKGGNLALAQANQAFENQLAKDNMMDFAQNTLGKTPEQAQAMADVTTRGDKADFIGRDVYRDNNANVNINPFQSNFGASNIVSYSPPDPNRQKSESEKMFERKRAFVSPQKQINSAAFKGMGYTRGR